MKSDDEQLNEIERLREELAETRAKLVDERRSYVESRAKLWEASDLLAQRVSQEEALRRTMAEQCCTPAERKVLEAWSKVPEALLRTVPKMPIHLFNWLLSPCEAELAKRGEKL